MLVPGHASAGTGNENDCSRVRAAIQALGVGKSARVEVKLRNKRKLTGYLNTASEDNFVLSDLKTGDEATVAYADVAQVKGQNLSRGSKIAIGVGIAVAVAVIAFVKWAGQFE